MTDILSPQPSNDVDVHSDALTGRLLEAARIQNHRIEVPPLDIAKSDFAHRLSVIAVNAEYMGGDGTTKLKERRGPRPLYAMVWASVVVLLLMVGISSISVSKDPRSGTVWTYATGNGRHGTLTLPDGSKVVLNVASRIEIPSDYEQGNRTLRLSGAALFEVAHANTSPFTVIAGSGTVRVLGTRFVVRHYATDSATTVAVQDGKVSIASTILTAHQQVTIGPWGVSPVTVASAGQFDILDGTLRFRDVSLPDAILELNRWYDADIRLGDATIAKQRVSGNFKMGSLTDLTAVLTMMFDVRIVQQGRLLTLYSTKNP